MLIYYGWEIWCQLQYIYFSVCAMISEFHGCNKLWMGKNEWSLCSTYGMHSSFNYSLGVCSLKASCCVGSFLFLKPLFYRLNGLYIYLLKGPAYSDMTYERISYFTFCDILGYTQSTLAYSLVCMDILHVLHRLLVPAVVI